MKDPLLPQPRAATGNLPQASSAHSGQGHQIKALTPAALAALFATTDHVLIIDVRKPDEIRHAGGFPVYLGVQVHELESSMPWIPRDRPIVTVSNRSNRAHRAAEVLTRSGFKVAGTIGIHDYKAQGGKLTISPRPCWLC